MKPAVSAAVAGIAAWVVVAVAVVLVPVEEMEMRLHLLHQLDTRLAVEGT